MAESATSQDVVTSVPPVPSPLPENPAMGIASAIGLAQDSVVQPSAQPSASQQPSAQPSASHTAIVPYGSNADNFDLLVSYAARTMGQEGAHVNQLCLFNIDVFSLCQELILKSCDKQSCQPAQHFAANQFTN